MLEALALTAALLSADATARDSDAFACWCEVSRFPDVAAWRENASEHMTWLAARQELDSDINPAIDELVAEQCLVLRAYSLVELVRARPFVPYDWERLEELRRLLGDEDYFAGRLPAPVTSMRQMNVAAARPG